MIRLIGFSLNKVGFVLETGLAAMLPSIQAEEANLKQQG
jgi:hypothetical protein